MSSAGGRGEQENVVGGICVSDAEPHLIHEADK